MRVSAKLPARALGLAVMLALCGCQGIDPTPGDEPPSPADRERFVRRRVEDAQAFRVQKRLEAAEHQLRLALGVDPDHARAHHLLARTLVDQGRSDEAALHEARAAALSPPGPAASDSPLVEDASGVLVLIVPPAPSAGRAREPGEWPNPRVPLQLARRLRSRLPKAVVSEATPDSLARTEGWLREHASRGAISFRVDEARCAESAKDGPFAIVTLSVVSARAGALPDEPSRVRSDDDRPAIGDDCADRALADAVDRALASTDVAGVLASSPQRTDATWSALALRALLPLGDLHASSEVARARAEAAEHGRPLDAATLIDRAETERASEREPSEAASTVEDPADEALEAELAAERRKRDELLAALRVDQLASRAPSPHEIGVLRTLAMKEPEGVGATLARERSRGAPIEVRVLTGPDGAELARFYFVPGASAPLLREEDSNHDGTPDRWTAYVGDRPREVLEDRGASGRVNARRWLAEDGLSTERIEIDMDADERPERVFHYAAGVLVGGDSDESGDGRLDRFERFEPDGTIASRDDDLDGDGTPDVRSEFKAGKLVRREFRDSRQAEASGASTLAAP
ncbi:hypothetical protein MYXO_01857 [Myxococcaceae bacterium]|jgi:hypothetical protein|nr:hypothetical protein MYXO_01857 [Myxococcaceae bacterium]